MFRDPANKIQRYFQRSKTRYGGLLSSVPSYLLIFSLLVSQAVSLNHIHADEAQDSVDCEICLKVNSDDDLLVNNSELLTPTPHAASDFVEAAEATYKVAINATARAPPFA